MTLVVSPAIRIGDKLASDKKRLKVRLSIGMDLYAANRTSKGKPLHYSPGGWEVLIRFLKDCGLETAEFTNVRAGSSISAETCFRVANTIDFHWDELSGTKAWLRDHAREWRRLAEAGGCQGG
jgi:hypothetical protein